MRTGYFARVVFRFGFLVRRAALPLVILRAQTLGFTGVGGGFGLWFFTDVLVIGAQFVGPENCGLEAALGARECRGIWEGRKHIY